MSLFRQFHHKEDADYLEVPQDVLCYYEKRTIYLGLCELA